MEIDYEFIPEYKLDEEKQKKLIKSYAGKLLEICDARTLVVGVDNFDKPFVLKNEGRLIDATDFCLETY